MMAMTLQQQVATATRLQTEHQLELWTAIHRTVLDGVDRLAELHLHAVREALGDSSALASRCVELASVPDLFATATGQVPPHLERLAAYTRQVADIAESMRKGVGQIVQEEIAQAQSQVTSSLPGLFPRIDSGDDWFNQWLQSVRDAADGGYAQMLDTAAQLAKSMPASTNLAATPQARQR